MQFLYALGNQKSLCELFYCNLHFIVVIWNQTRNIPQVSRQKLLACYHLFTTAGKADMCSHSLILHL